MKLLLAGLLAFSTLSVSPAIVVASSDVAVTCGPNVPEAMKRPGGYCDQIESIDNIGTERDHGPDTHCDRIPVNYRMLLQRGIKVQVADNSCCSDTSEATLPSWLTQHMLSRTDAAVPLRLAINLCPR